MQIFNNNNITLLGMQWGDEGKGKVTDTLSEHYDFIARFQGGHNAGHTLYYQQRKIILHLIPSGILHAHSTCIIGPGVVLSLDALLTEMQELDQAGIHYQNRLLINPECSLILPNHALLDQLREDDTTERSIGTTRRGIGPAHEDKIARRSLRLGDIVRNDFAERLAHHINLYHAILAASSKNYQASSLPNCEQLHAKLKSQYEKIKPYIADTAQALLQAHQSEKKIIFEGAQGCMLDVSCGTYPYVTSANCLASGTAQGSGIYIPQTPIGITKAYTTRVGEGPFPSESNEDIALQISEIGQEVGATTGRKRRIGWLDLPALRYAIRLNGIKQCIVTKLDVFDQIDQWQVTTHYLDECGKKLELPKAGGDWSKYTPINQTVKGWNPSKVSGCKHLSDFPQQALDYVKLIEETCQVQVIGISTGVERDDFCWL